MNLLHPAPSAAAPASPPGLAPIEESALLRQKIVTALRRAIEQGAIGAGDRLVEKDLCNRLGVSRTSLREALRDLEANGIVTKVNARELVVTRLNAEDAANLFRLRGAIESLVARQFIEHATAEDLAICRAANQAILTKAPGPESQDAQRDFYRLWCAGGRNPIAFDMLMNLQFRLSVVRSPSLQDRQSIATNVADRALLLDRLAAKDGDGAQKAVTAHIERAISLALNASPD